MRVVEKGRRRRLETGTMKQGLQVFRAGVYGMPEEVGMVEKPWIDGGL